MTAPLSLVLCQLSLAVLLIFDLNFRPLSLVHHQTLNFVDLLEAFQTLIELRKYF